MTDQELAKNVVEPPEDASFVHGSGATRFYTGDEKPTYYEIDFAAPDGRRTLTVINLPQLAAAIDTSETNTIDVHGAPARGVPLLTNGHLGADMLYVPPGESFPLHVHAGHHFLFCVRGEGTVTFDGHKIPINPGDMYCIEAAIPHAVGATDEGPGHWLVAFGAPHAPLDSEHRMEVLVGDEADQ